MVKPPPLTIEVNDVDSTSELIHTQLIADGYSESQIRTMWMHYRLINRLGTQIADVKRKRTAKTGGIAI